MFDVQNGRLEKNVRFEHLAGLISIASRLLRF